jgi:hypothetical protein
MTSIFTYAIINVLCWEIMLFGPYGLIKGFEKFVLKPAEGYKFGVESYDHLYVYMLIYYILVALLVWIAF